MERENAASLPFAGWLNLNESTWVGFAERDRLQLSPEKTVITHVSEGFDFLGQNLRMYGNKLLIKPSKKNTHAFLEKVRDIIDDNKSAAQRHLIRFLNRVIRGWASYHRNIVAAEAFERVDFEIWRKLWLWARSRHSGKPRRWVAKRYFHHIGRRTWTFAADIGGQMTWDKSGWLRLCYATDTKIWRHIKIRAEANPFDPTWWPYLAERKFLQRKLNPAS